MNAEQKAEPQGEPVAWAVPDKWHPELLGECTFDLGTAKDWKRRGEVLTPLYLHPTPDAQPVAWMWQHDETGRVGFVDQWQLDNGWEKNNPRCHITRPLFDHPAPAQTPLTEDEILKLWDSRWLEHPLLDGNELTLAFVRAVERAHGIGAKA